MLKTQSLILLMFVSFPYLKAQKVISSAIKHVTVYRSGAEIQRQVKIKTLQGENTIRIENLSGQIEASSIRSMVSEGMVITGLTYEQDFLNSADNAGVKVLQDSLDIVDKEMEFLSVMKGVYQQEQSFLMENKKIQMNEKSIYTDELEDVYAFFEKKISETLFKILEVDREQKKLQDTKNRLQQQLAQRRSINNRPKGVVILELNATRAMEGEVKLIYQMHNAGWNMEYDFRLDSKNLSAQVFYNARVWQNSLVDWDNVSLKLSSNRPSNNQTAPNPSPIWLSDVLMNKSIAPPATMRAVYAGAKLDESEKEQNQFKQMDYSSSIASNASATTNIEYDITIPYHIPSGVNGKNIQVQNQKSPVVFQYYAAPKYVPSVYLKGFLPEWENLDLVEGMASVYYNGMFMGKRGINPQFVSDSLDLSVGEVRDVFVERKLNKDLSSKKNIGSSKKEDIAYEIKLRSISEGPVNIKIQDQIPLSKWKEVEVKLLEQGNAQLEETTGVLTWQMVLKPKEEKTLKFSYSVKYPKERTLNGIK